MAEAAAPLRAGPLYGQLGEKLPEIKEYSALWAAVSAMPDLTAVGTLQHVIALRPQSPAAYEAHIALARYYASSGAPQAGEECLAALALNDDEGLRLELARRLEAQGDDQGAYAQYVRLLNKLPDAFEGVRRAGHDPLLVAKDLIAAGYNSDALDTLRTSADPAALPLRAQAMATLGRSGEAETAYRQWLAQNPSDTAAITGWPASSGKRATPTRPWRSTKRWTLLPAALPRRICWLRQTLPPASSSSRRWSSTSLRPIRSPGGPPLASSNSRATSQTPCRFTREVAASDSPFADDAAYRLFILGQKLADEKTVTQGRALLDRQGLNWLALRAGQAGLNLELAPAAASAGQEILAKARALAEIGRADLAHLELVLAAVTPARRKSNFPWPRRSPLPATSALLRRSRPPTSAITPTPRPSSGS